MDGHTNADLFFHIRVIVGVVMGLSVTRLLTGVARFVAHPGSEPVYPVHLGWVLYLLLAVIHFWWFEFGLARVQHWTFDVYFFVVFYAILFFLTAAVLLPDRLGEHAGFADYFHNRQKWFYGLLAGLFVTDLADTALKGLDHFFAFGIEYPIRQGILFVLAFIAMFVRDRRYHGFFVAVALVAEVEWILQQFYTIN